MPAAFLWHEVLEPRLDLKPTGVEVLSVDGSVWDGRALVRFRRLESIVDWDFDFSSLLALKLGLDVDIESHAGSGRAKVSAGLSEYQLHVEKMDLVLAQLNPLLVRQRIKLSGNAVVNNVILTSNGEQLNSAEGLIAWSGGQISYPAGRTIHEREMPPFKGVLGSSDALGAYIGIRDPQASFDVIEANVSPDGVAMVQIKRRLLDLADEPWPQRSAPEDVVFKIKKPLW